MPFDADRFFTLSPDLACVADFKGYFLHLNPAWEGTLGYTLEELRKSPFLDFVHPDDRDATIAEMQNLTGGKKTLHFENRYRCKDGAYRWLAWTALPLLDEGLIYATARDISDRKKVEELERTRVRLEAEVAERKRTEDQLATRAAVTRIVAEAETLQGAAPGILEAIGATIGWDLGEMWSVERHGQPLRYIEGWCRPHSNLEAFLRDSRAVRIAPSQGLAGQVWTTGAPSWIADVEKHPGFVRSAAALKCGLHGAFAFPILTGGRVSAVLSFFSRSIRQPEADLLKMTADLGVLIGQLIARKRVEEQLFHSQKVEAIGRLAGGVAHDFNNLLTVITGYSELALAEIPENDRMHPNLEEIRKAAQRAAALTRQLLAFSRQQPVEPKLVDLNGIIKDMERMLVRLIGEDVELSTSLAPHLGRVNADPGQLEQVIVNLAVNARDAMPHGGKLVLETTNIDLDDTYCQSHPEARPVPHVQLSVTDTGTGMDAETQARIFEPFFTTKESGKGTGLGLSTVHGIVKQNGGHLEVYSELGRGTTFKVYLPRSQKSGQTSKIIRPQSKPARGSETILVAEDSESVRKLMKEILRSCGYQVLEADEGSRALDVCDRHEGPIHLLVTDTVMPGMSGPELAQHVRRKKPGIRILLTSGYTERGMSNHGLPEQGHPFLEKPFTVESLTHKVREVLDTPLGP